MATTLRKIIYDIKGLIRDARSNDMHFTDRQVAFWIYTLRSKLIKERLDKGQTIGDANYQFLERLPLEVTSEFTGHELMEGECQVLRTGKLPEFIEKDGEPLIQTIRGSFYKSKIIFLPKVQAIRIKNNKYTKNMNVAFHEDGYIYVLGGDSFMDELFLGAVFDDPDAVNQIVNGGPIGLDDPFPIENNLIDTIKEIILTKNLSVYLALPQDRVNDAETAY